MFFGFSEGLGFLAEDFDLVLAFEKAALEFVFFSGGYLDLVLHVAVFEGVFLKFLLVGDQLLGLVIELILDVVDVGVQAGDCLLQVVDLLVFR